MESINSLTAHRQWATRPEDERFHSISDLRDALSKRRVDSYETVVDPQDLEIIPKSGDLMVSQRGNLSMMTNWSASQLARITGAGNALFDLAGDPGAPYPEEAAEIAARYLNFGLKRRAARIQTSRENHTRGRLAKPGLNIYSFSADGETVVRAVNSEVYSRYFDVDALDFLVSHAVPAGFEPPLANPSGIFGAPDISKGARPGGLYASDRDVFALLVNKANPVEVRGDLLFRGIILRHSEVGDGALRLDAFHLRNICGNHIFFGLQNVLSVKIRHIGEIDTKIKTAFDQNLIEYVNRDTSSESSLIGRAMDKVVAKNDDDAVDYLVSKRFTQKLAERSVEHAVQEEGGAGTVWQLVQGVTAYARSIVHLDQRTALERKAGELLAVA